MPLSVFVPEVTLIALSIPAGGHSAPSSREQPIARGPRRLS
jgi:hypothetical protein